MALPASRVADSADRAVDGLHIGELARLSATSTRSLRYYEQRGLISADRDHNGYRRYPHDTVQLVANLRRLLDAGLSIDDVHQFGSCVRAPDLDATPCTSGLEIYERRLAALDTKIATLNHLRSVLADQADQLRRDAAMTVDRSRPAPAAGGRASVSSQASDADGVPIGDSSRSDDILSCAHEPDRLYLDTRQSPTRASQR